MVPKWQYQHLEMIIDHNRMRRKSRSKRVGKIRRPRRITYIRLRPRRMKETKSERQRGVKSMEYKKREKSAKPKRMEDLGVEHIMI